MGQVYSRFIAFITFFEFLYSGPQDPGFWGLWNSGFGAVEARLWGLQKHGCGDCRSTAVGTAEARLWGLWSRNRAF